MRSLLIRCLDQSQYNLCTRVDHPPNTTNITIDHHCNYLFPLVHCETLSSSSTDDYCFITCVLSYGLFWSYLIFLFMSGHCPRLFMYIRHSRYRMVADIPPSIIEKFGFISLIFAISVGIMSNITFNRHIYLNLSYGSGLIGLNISQLIAFLTSIVLAYWLGSHASRRSSFIINEWMRWLIVHLQS